MRLLSSILIIAGVLAWVPFLAQVIGGQSPPVLPYLAGHLAGVLSGAWLRSRAAQVGASSAPELGRFRRSLSKVLIYLGVLVWLPYFALTRLADAELEVTGFLAAHLIGVVGGALLRISVEIERRSTQ